MNSPSASNGSFCGGNAADLQSKLPKTLSERAKTQGVSRSGISNGILIALVRKVTFAKKAIETRCETPLTVFAFLFCYHAKQKFDCVWVVALPRFSITIAPHSAQGDAKNIHQEFLAICFANRWRLATAKTPVTRRRRVHASLRMTQKSRHRVFGNLLRKSAVFSRRKNSRYSPKASSCSAQDDT